MNAEEARIIRRDHRPGSDICMSNRTPCVVYELADQLVTLLERGGDRARMGCPECTITQQMDPNPPTLRCIVCGTGYWTEGDR